MVVDALRVSEYCISFILSYVSDFLDCCLSQEFLTSTIGKTPVGGGNQIHVIQITNESFLRNGNLVSTCEISV